jgi:hypothetical protein
MVTGADIDDGLRGTKGGMNPGRDPGIGPAN